MSTHRARSITRWTAVAVMAAAVVTATADGFAQSYAGLYAWALNHGLYGWKAASFPLMVDLLIAVGELGLFLLAIDAYTLRRRQFLSWFDFLLPLMIAIAGWTASLIFNVGHVQEREFSYRATAAVPPIVSMLGLLVLLRTLHRYVSERARDEPAGADSGAAVAVADTTPAAAPAAPGGVPPQSQHYVFFSTPAAGGSASPGAARPGGLRLVRLTDWPGGERPGSAQPAAAARPAPPEPAPANGPADSPANGPAPAAVRSSQGPTGNGAGNGHVPAGGDAPDARSAEPSPVSTMDRPQASKDRLLEELHRHHGDIAAAIDALRMEGLTYGEQEAHRLRRNVWLPYIVYRLLAQHGGDVHRVSQDLADKRIECDTAVLEELAGSWQ